MSGEDRRNSYQEKEQTKKINEIRLDLRGVFLR